MISKYFDLSVLLLLILNVGLCGALFMQIPSYVFLKHRGTNECVYYQLLHKKLFLIYLLISSHKACDFPDLLISCHWGFSDYWGHNFADLLVAVTIGTE